MSATEQATETRGVLAGAYKGGRRALLTHLVAVDASGFEVRVFCRGVRLDSVADHYDGSDETRAARPTCRDVRTSLGSTAVNRASMRGAKRKGSNDVDRRRCRGSS